MPGIRPFATVAVAAGLVLLGVAAPAAAYPGNPPDCTVTFSPNPATGPTASMTCTARPSSQQWREAVVCSPFATGFSGNTVTGDGTSTVTCPGAGRRASNATFVVIN